MKLGCFPCLGDHCPVIPKVQNMYHPLPNVQYMNLPFVLTSSTVAGGSLSKRPNESLENSSIPSGSVSLYLPLPANPLTTFPTTNGLINSALSLTSTPSGIIFTPLLNEDLSRLFIH